MVDGQSSPYRIMEGLPTIRELVDSVNAPAIFEDASGIVRNMRSGASRGTISD
jgi:hypothetical protein